MVNLIALLQATQNTNGVLYARLTDKDLLETTLQRSILLDVLAVLIQGRRTDQAELTTSQHRLNHVARIHRAITRGASANDGVNLIDEGNNLTVGFLNLVQNRLQALLELTAVLRTGDHGA